MSALEWTMTGGSDAMDQAVTALLARCPDRALPAIAKALHSARGARAAHVFRRVEAERRERARIALGFGGLTALFQPRVDGVDALTWRPDQLRPILNLAVERARIPLDGLDDEGPLAGRIADRLWAVAAGVIRDRPELAGGPEAAEALAACFDLSAPLRRAMPQLPVWIGRPDEKALTELRLFVRDCGDLSPDGLYRAMDVFLAHFADAHLILRVVVEAAGSSARRGVVAASELAVFVTRLLDAAERRAGALKSERVIRDVAARIADVAWCAALLAEISITLDPPPASPWNLRASAVRTRVGAYLNAGLDRCEKAVRRALPTERATLTGSMTREIPRLHGEDHNEAIEEAMGLLGFLAGMRSSASAFGCEARRRHVQDKVVERLSAYADEALSLLNDGDVENERAALTRIGRVADLLATADAPDPARTVRRRLAVAGSILSAGASPVAA